MQDEFLTARTLALVALLSGLPFMGRAFAMSKRDDPLAALRWKHRVLLVFAAKLSDPDLLRQRALFQVMGADARERDMKLVEVIGHTDRAVALRKRFHLDHQGFHVLLIGKDGGDKLSSSEPIGSGVLSPLIDSMPMRQEEMRRKE